jgi:DNA/RNA endonuclease YhcR with UshA esterase domain
MPRRTFSRVSQRLLHDRTADRIASAVGRIPHVAATIVPFDTTLSHEAIERIEAKQQAAAAAPALRAPGDGAVTVPHPSVAGITAIGAATWRQKVTVQGRVKAVQLGGTAGRSLEVQLFDDTGGLRLLFMGRTHLPGLTCGALVRATGRVGQYRGHLAIANPRYELLSPSG